MHLTMDCGEAQATWHVDRFVGVCKEKIIGFLMVLGAYIGPNSYPVLSSFELDEWRKRLRIMFTQEAHQWREFTQQNNSFSHVN